MKLDLGRYLPNLARRRSLLTRLFDLAVAVTREMAGGQLSLHAMSLVYTTLLSLVPLLAVSFSVLKAFGVHNQIEPLLNTFLAPLGAQGHEITQQVIGFVEHMQVGVLGALGLSLLLYTVISLVQKIEAAFNYAWRVAALRPLGQRFSQYLSVLTVGPILVFSALGITGTLLSSGVMSSLMAMQPLGTLIAWLGKLLSYVLVIAAFTLIYILIPNTKVRFSSALLGATIAGLVWQTGGWAFGSFIVSSSRYTAIYAGFAIVILFMIWLYLSWVILLFGASVAFYFQHPEYRGSSRAPRCVSPRAQETLALSVMNLLGHAYIQGASAWTMENLARQIRLPTPYLERLLTVLEAGDLVTRTANEPPGYIPSRTLESITIKTLLDVVRAAGDKIDNAKAIVSPGSAVAALCDEIDAHLNDSLRGRTLKDLVSAENEFDRVTKKV